ncbi:MAG: hypothetical protein ACO4AI_00255 [Prochlorothrix sp.]|nr:hypothetical protein [Prochlorothrix sp.]
MVNPVSAPSPQLAALLLDTLEGDGKGTLAGQATFQRSLVQAIDRYQQFYAQRYAQVSLLGLSQPVPLDKV